MNKALKSGALFTLGLDIGTSSIGWCLLETDEYSRAQDLVDAGVRIFPEGMDRTRGEKSLKQDRREARSLRRQTYRRARRKDKVKHVLQRLSLLPESEKALNKLYQDTSPYVLRAQALHEKLTPHELGRALYHLAQRRGYYSNRVRGEEKDGAVAKGISSINEALSNDDFATLGEYLASLNPHKQRIRDRYTARQMYLDEFAAIWQAQQPYHPKILTAKARDELHEAIFFQRPLKKQKYLVGKCTFEKQRKRAAAAALLAQEFRLWSSLNQLKILFADGTERYLTDDERLLLANELHYRDNWSWSAIRKKLNFLEDTRFNLERNRKSGMLGNQTAAIVSKAIGKKAWIAMNERDQEQLVYDLLNIDTETGLVNRLNSHYGFTAEQTAKLLTAAAKLPDKYMHLSQTALRKILPALKQYNTEEQRAVRYDEACVMAGYHHSKKDKVDVYDELPFPQELTKNLRNPLVERAIYQIRNVVNAIVREYGKPQVIRIEMARDLKQSAKQREAQEKRNKANEKLNKEAIEFLKKEMGYHRPSRGDILKYKLWKELPYCPYTGDSEIAAHELFGNHPVYEVEHIIPYSRCLDDSFMNKTLCHVDENRRKGNLTPYELYEGDPKRYEEVMQRAKHLPQGKHRRFGMNALQELDGFVSQQLNETRYIAKVAKDYLAHLGCQVEPVTGGTTALLRTSWGLNNLLSEEGLKNRDDHRHHAVDALVIALTTRSDVKKLNTAHARADGSLKLPELPIPLPNGRQQMAKCLTGMVVSHKVQRKVKGPLHEETLYGYTGEVNKKGDALITIRKKLAELSAKDLDNIRDPHIREQAKAHLAASKNVADAFKNPDNPFVQLHPDGHAVPVHKVRLIKPLKTETIASGKRQRHVKTGSNHHIAIIEYEQQGKTKWRGEVVSTLEAMRRLKANGSVVQEPGNPDERLIMVLHNNDMITLTHEGERKIYLVQKMRQNGQLYFRLHNDAKDRKDLSLTVNKLPGSLQKTHPEKLEVSMLGRLQPARQ